MKQKTKSRILKEAKQMHEFVKEIFEELYVNECDCPVCTDLKQKWDKLNDGFEKE